MTSNLSKIRVVLVGWVDEELRSLFKDALDIELVEPDQAPDLVFAVIALRDPFRTLASAQAAGGPRTPIIAILPIADERLSRRALVAGAQFCWPLDGSLQTLRATLLGMVPDGAWPEKEKQKPA